MLVAACAPIRAHPDDPEDTDATLTSLKPYFDGTKEKDYNDWPATDAAGRKQKRDEIVLSRVHAYDIEFSNFEDNLFEESNGLSTGSDLILLVLTGLTATTGGAGVKAALGAASAGIVGAQATINKDLFYQKTIPALLAQMEANRATAKLTIFQGLNQPDEQYSLGKADLDLYTLKQAGSIRTALTQITATAGDQKKAADDQITFLRSPEYLAELPIIKNIHDAASKLTPQQQLTLVKSMQPYLASRPQQIQQLVKGLDPTDARLNGNTTSAKDVINAWIEEEDMNAANQKQWSDAIAAAAQH